MNNRHQIYLERAQREHDLLIERTNIFLIFNSILMAGFALGSTVPSVIFLLPTLGLLTSLIWVYIGQRSLMTAEYFWSKVIDAEAALDITERVFTEFFEWRAQSRYRIIGFTVTVYIARILPGIWVLTWLAVAILGW